MVVDDVHWCDAASVDLLQTIATSAGNRAALIFAARSGELADNSAVLQVLRGLRHDGQLTELHLDPLDDETTVALVQSIAPGADAGRVAQESGGNPLFAIALTSDPETQTSEGMPRSLRDLVADRVDRLPAPAAEVLRWASVLGVHFDTDTLLTVSGGTFDTLAAALEIIERHDFIRGSIRNDYGFAHDLVHRAVYSTLSEPRRRLMHLRAANVLRDRSSGVEPRADEIVRHAVLGGDHGMAAAACVEAGIRSLRLFGNVEASAFARRGLRHSEQLVGPERVKRRIELTRIAVLAERPNDSGGTVAVLEELAESALDLDCPDHARIAYETLSLLRWERGSYLDAERDTIRAELASRNTDDGTRALALAETARCLAMLERDLPRADAMLMEATALARRAGVETATIPDAAGMLRFHRGDLDPAAEDFHRARFLARRDGDRITEFFALEHLAMLELSRRNMGAVSVIAADMKKLASRIGAGSEAPFAAALDAVCRFDRDEAQADLDAAVLALRQADAKQRLSMILRMIAGIERDRGHAEIARAAAEEALALASVMNSKSEMAQSRTLLIEITDGADDVSTAGFDARVSVGGRR